MLMKACPRCKKLIPHGQTYCETCKPIAEAQAAEALARKQKRKNNEYNRKRDPKYLAFYRSKDWKTLSRAKLQACGYKCELQLEGCTGLAVEVDHTEAIQTPAGWYKRLDWENLKGVCTNCHNRKHDRFKKKKDDGVIDLRTLER